MNGSPSFAPLGFPAPTHLGRVEQQIFLCVGTEAGFLSSALPDGMEPWPWWPSGAVFLSFTHATHCHFGPLPVDRLGFLEASVSVPVVKPGSVSKAWKVRILWRFVTLTNVGRRGPFNNIRRLRSTVTSE